MLALWVDGQFLPPFDMPIDGTPCEKVIESATLIHYSENILKIFLNNLHLREFKATSYIGMPLADSDSKIIGNLAVIDTRAFHKADRAQNIIKIFAARASAELQRILSEAGVRHREE